MCNTPLHTCDLYMLIHFSFVTSFYFWYLTFTTYLFLSFQACSPARLFRNSLPIMRIRVHECIHMSSPNPTFVRCIGWLFETKYQKKTSKNLKPTNGIEYVWFTTSIAIKSLKISRRIHMYSILSIITKTLNWNLRWKEHSHNFLGLYKNVQSSWFLPLIFR